MANDWPYRTARWQHVRKRQLAREPLCRACRSEGYVTSAREVDHIVTIKNGGAVWDPANLQSLCVRHHALKSGAYDQQGKNWNVYALRGCLPDGSPRSKDD